jgi:hypothetical protein
MFPIWLDEPIYVGAKGDGVQGAPPELTHLARRKRVRLRFMSNNAFKIAEVQRILGSIGVEVVPVGKKIEEIQTTDIDALV